MSIVDPLPYYAHHGPITDPGEYAGLLDNLPTDVAGLCQVVQGLLVHYCFLSYYGRPLTDERRPELQLRHVRKLLARIRELDDRPLTVARPPEKRLVICCRDFATMLCAILRHQGQPARARCGFATYFHGPDSTPGFHVDHWVCEVWRAAERRWVLVDAEVDENEREFGRVEIDTLDVPRDQFLVAGRVWQLCRAGEADPATFGIFGESGLHYVQSQLVRDLAAMNQMELLCWDCWGLGDASPDQPPSIEELALLDRVAALTQADNDAFGELRAVYSDERLRVPPVVTSYTDAGPRQVRLTATTRPGC